MTNSTALIILVLHILLKNFKGDEEKIHEVDLGYRTIKQISRNTWNLKHGVAFNWLARYQIEDKGELREIEDESVLRAFFPEELEYFLTRKALEVVELLDRDFAFTILAQKKL